MPLLTTRQVATLLHHDPSTIRTWIRDGDLPARRVCDGYLIERSSLPAVIALATPAEARPDPACAGTVLDTHQLRDRYGENTDGAVTSSSRHPHSPEELMPDLSQYLSLASAADRVDRSTRTVRRWVLAGDLPRTLRIKGRLLIHPGDLDAMFEPVDPSAYADSAA